MSNRSSYNRQEKSNSNSNSNNNHSSNNRGGGGGYRGKTQKIFVPKTSNSNSPSPITKPQTLSSSLRQQSIPDSASETRGSSSSSSRVRLGENGEWVSTKGNFVNYLPQDEAVAIGLGADEGGLDAVESQRVVDLLNRELARLLKLKPREFWRQVAADTSLNEFLDSFLQFRSRWYDFPFHGTKGVVAGVIVGDLELSRRVFMTLYRISSHRDPGVRASESLSKKDHEALLQDKKLLDLPKLLDICAVYGHENEELTQSLVVNAINAQPELLESCTAMVSHFLGIVHTMQQRCQSSLEVLISAGGCEDHGSSQRNDDYLEVMDFLNDAFASMHTFITIYRPAAVLLSCPVDSSHGNQELIDILATLHDLLLPFLQEGLQIILGSEDATSPMLSEVSISLRSLSTRIVDLGWKLLENCYLGDDLFKDDLYFPAAMKMFPANVEDPVIRADILVQCFREIATVSQDAKCRNLRNTYLQNIDKKFQILHRIQSLQQSGWLSVDDEQYQYLAGILTHPIPTVLKSSPSAPNSVGGGLQMDEDAAIVESKISQVKDLFPDYGKGFILACLEVYDHNPEEAIQRILEGTLHEDLRNLDTSMETLPPKPTQTVTKNDKGKGILVEPLISQHPAPKVVSSSASSLPSPAGRFIRKSRGDKHDDDVLKSRDEKLMEKMSALLSQYEYEDEYDDSFDDLGMTIVESSVEETETLGDKVRSRMNLPTRDQNHTHTQSQSQSQSSAQSAAKWGTRKKPQFYVKDGKNYSYKVEGSIAVADEQQASIVTQAQKETIHGLGRGGNRPLGAVKMWEEHSKVEGDESNPSDMDSGDNAGQGRGRGRGRRGGGGGRNSHYRKDRAMKKHIAGVGGF
ncbi:hypothetical protein RND81_01G093300 [Saponaria officinalis]|uniref:CUE domain-containing protein n=1 Tax=Saponaria officinalis TaxID=3572 RepID=A0AAW1NE38_SAPOF